MQGITTGDMRDTNYRPHTNADDERLIEYLATHDVKKGSASTYQSIVNNEDRSSPWGATRTWAAWRSRYAHHKQDFDRRIKQYQLKHTVHDTSPEGNSNAICHGTPNEFDGSHQHTTASLNQSNFNINSLNTRVPVSSYTRKDFSVQNGSIKTTSPSSTTATPLEFPRNFMGNHPPFIMFSSRYDGTTNAKPPSSSNSSSEPNNDKPREQEHSPALPARMARKRHRTGSDHALSSSIQTPDASKASTEASDALAMGETQTERNLGSGPVRRLSQGTHEEHDRARKKARMAGASLEFQDVFSATPVREHFDELKRSADVDLHPSTQRPMSSPQAKGPGTKSATAIESVSHDLPRNEPIPDAMDRFPVFPRESTSSPITPRHVNTRTLEALSHSQGRTSERDGSLPLSSMRESDHSGGRLHSGRAVMVPVPVSGEPFPSTWNDDNARKNEACEMIITVNDDAREDAMKLNGCYRAKLQQDRKESRIVGPNPLVAIPSGLGWGGLGHLVA